MVTQGAETAIQTGSGRLIDVIPYVLCLCCIVLDMGCMYLDVHQGTPASPYILWRGRVTRKVSYLVLYNILRCTSTSAVHVLILWAGPPLIVQPMSSYPPQGWIARCALALPWPAFPSCIVFLSFQGKHLCPARFFSFPHRRLLSVYILATLSEIYMPDLGAYYDLWSFPGFYSYPGYLQVC